MKIPEKEDKPDPFKAAFPEGVFPDQVSPEVEETLHQDGKGGKAHGPEPHIRNSQNFGGPVRIQGVIKDNTRDGEHEHDLNVPAHHGAKGCVARCGPEGGPLGEDHDPGVPCLVEEIHAKEGETGQDGIPVPGLPGFFDLPGIDIHDDEQQGDDIPFEGGNIP